MCNLAFWQKEQVPQTTKAPALFVVVDKRKKFLIYEELHGVQRIGDLFPSVVVMISEVCEKNTSK